ncbi:unnamed protein product, partial [Mesorhabditis belari]|uniref:Uncharacterized protein n=1 Tax=Mesorhabditis belari TaxID=2138241 RepID=A0AAF3EMX3_9BILA
MPHLQNSAFLSSDSSDAENEDFEQSFKQFPMVPPQRGFPPTETPQMPPQVQQMPNGNMMGFMQDPNFMQQMMLFMQQMQLQAQHPMQQNGAFNPNPAFPGYGMQPMQGIQQLPQPPPAYSASQTPAPQRSKPKPGNGKPRTSKKPKKPPVLPGLPTSHLSKNNQYSGPRKEINSTQQFSGSTAEYPAPSNPSTKRKKSKLKDETVETVTKSTKPEVPLNPFRNFDTAEPPTVQKERNIVIIASTMASDPMFASASAFLNALDEGSDSGTNDGQADDASATEWVSHCNDHDADVKKKIVLFNLPEPFGDDQMKEETDRNAFLEVLYAIKAESLAGNIREIKREGRFEQNGKPRRVIVTFTDENVQRIVVECAPQLSKIRQLKHLALYAYKSTQTRADRDHGGTSQKVPDQKFEQRGHKQHGTPSNVQSNDVTPNHQQQIFNNSFGFAQNSAMSGNGQQNGMNGQHHANQQAPFPQMFNNAFGLAPQGNGQQNGMNGQHHANQQAPFPPQMFNNAFGFAPPGNPQPVSPMPFNPTDPNGMNGQHQANQQVPLPQQMFNNSFGYAQNFCPPGNQSAPPIPFNPTDPQFQMMMMQMYGMFLNSQQAQQNNPSVPSNVPTSANEFSEESEESEESDEESLTEEEQNDEPTNEFFKHVQPANFGKYKKTVEKEIPVPSSGGRKKQQQKNNKNKYKKNENKKK